MSDIVIQAEGLGKLYRIGQRVPYLTLRDTLAGVLARSGQALRGAAPEQDDSELWALKDASFEIRRGEVVGLIGANGAGKSTLLKVLSRVVKPTVGRAQVRGRIGSLLEVGTGFHPELSGRENTFLNGAILGMSKRDILRKFDEIIAFAEIDRFIDTPVKYYSDGMYVRLAFSVAAHLEPDILMVDEVLSVGDAAFQKKCLQRINEAARQGTTVLFVSHNLAAGASLCSSAIVMESGRIQSIAATQKAIAEYLSSVHGRGMQEYRLEGTERPDPYLGRELEFISMALERTEGEGTEGKLLATAPSLSMSITVRSNESVGGFRFHLTIYTVGGVAVGSCSTAQVDPIQAGETATFHLRLANPALVAGHYYFDVGMEDSRQRPGFPKLDFVSEVLHFEVPHPTEESPILSWNTNEGLIRFPAPETTKL